MKRIRISGNDTFDNTTIKCKECGQAIITKGEPMAPLYFVDNNGNHYCTRCGD